MFSIPTFNIGADLNYEEEEESKGQVKNEPKTERHLILPLS